MGQPAMVWSFRHLRELAFRQMQTTGTMYFRAPEDKVQDMCVAMAKRRGLVRNIKWRYEAAMRRDGYIKRAREGGIAHIVGEGRHHHQPHAECKPPPPSETLFTFPYEEHLFAFYQIQKVYSSDWQQ